MATSTLTAQTSENCSDCEYWANIHKINGGVLKVYFSCSILSVFAVILVWIALALMPTLRRHPAQLLFNRTMLDLVICFCHIATYAMDIYPVRNDDSNKQCMVTAFIFQVAVFGSSGWYFLLSLDLFLIIRNPFCQPKEYLKSYYTGLYLLSLLSGVALLAGDQYGLNYFNYCWARSEFNDKPVSSKTVLWFVCLLYGPWLVTSLMSLGIVIFSAYALRQGLPSSDATRKHVIRFAFVCTAFFAGEWVVVSLLVLIRAIIGGNLTADHVSTLRSTTFLYACLDGLRGVFDAVVWLIAGILIWREGKQRQRQCLHEKTDQTLSMDELQIPRIREVSSVLRHDMIRCTSWGIVDSASVSATSRQMLDSDNFTAAVEGSNSNTVALHTHSEREAQCKQVLTRRIHCPVALQNAVFDFRDYEPDLFCRLRALVGVDRRTYCHSFSIPDSTTSALVERFTEGKSGSFFYFTQDGRYIVKTVSPSEASLLHNSLHAFCSYLEEYPDSLLGRFFGLHAMRLSPEQKFITLAVMENLFPNEECVKPSEKYDLKGSWVGRTALTKKDQAGGKYTSSTLKDNDVYRRFRIGPQRKQQLMEQLTQDVDFLVGLGIMDYSLLVGVRDLDEDPSQLNLPQEVVQVSGNEAFRANSVGQPPDLPCLVASNCNPATRARYVSWHRRFCGGILSCPPAKSPDLTDCLVTDSVLVDDFSTKWSVYYVGIIDLLQKYNLSKRLEQLYKTKILCKDKLGISVARPYEYGQRFLRAVETHFE